VEEFIFAFRNVLSVLTWHVDLSTYQVHLIHRQVRKCHN
jgi:hypothetical protein